jgi:integrase
MTLSVGTPMTPRKRKSRVYWRAQGGVRRAYADFRDYRDVGGTQEALRAAGEPHATTDPDVAQVLAAHRLRELDELRRNRSLHGRSPGATLGAFAAAHLVKKAKAGKVTEGWLEMAEVFLRRAVEFLGADRALEAVRVSDVERWAAHLATVEGRNKKPLSAGTIRHHLNALSNLYRRAQSDEAVPAGYNPCAAMLDKPTGRQLEAAWLEVPDAALLLEAARTLPSSPGLTAAVVYPLLATFLLTGGRRSEVLGLEVEDVSFTRGTVTFRPNAFRRLKTRTSARVIPLWPQLREALTAYLSARTAGEVFADRPPSPLLFPSPVYGALAPLAELRRMLDRTAIRAGWAKGEIRSRRFRNAYCAARLQTLDRGAPVSVFTVARELGHGGDSLVKRIYGHLGDVRHRAEVVEYRVEQHVEALAPRLERMAAR